MENNTKIKTPWQSTALAVLLCVLAAAGMALYFLLPDREFSAQENRNLAPFPTFSWEKVVDGTFMQQLESYANDQFAGRDMWVKLNAAVIRATGRAENKDVYFGRDGYLLEKLSPRPAGVLEKNAARLAELAALTGLPVHVLAAPSASHLLAEKLPAYAPSADQDAYAAELIAMLDGTGASPVTPETLAARPEDAYFRTDHHWNARGAYRAYRDLCAALGIAPRAWEDYDVTCVSDSFYGTMYSASGAWWVEPDVIERVTFPGAEAVTQRVVDDGSIHSMFWEENLAVKDQYTYFLGGNHALTVLENPAGGDRKLLVIKDSYAHILAPYLAEHFGEVHLLDPRYYRGGVGEYAAAEGITDIAVVMTLSSLCSDAMTLVLR